MHEKVLSILSGSSVGFVTGISTGKIVEAVVLSVVGGFLGALGGTLWRWMRRCYLQQKENKKNIK